MDGPPGRERSRFHQFDKPSSVKVRGWENIVGNGNAQIAVVEKQSAENNVLAKVRPVFRITRLSDVESHELLNQVGIKVFNSTRTSDINGAVPKSPLSSPVSFSDSTC